MLLCPIIGMLLSGGKQKKYPGLTISKIIQAIKSYSARQIVDYLYKTGRRGPLTRTTRSVYPHHRMSEQKYHIWQTSFYDFNIYSEEKMRQKLNYTHNNPVRANLVKNPADYKYSSYRNYYLDDHSIIKISIIDI